MLFQNAFVSKVTGTQSGVIVMELTRNALVCRQFYNERERPLLNCRYNLGKGCQDTSLFDLQCERFSARVKWATIQNILLS
jgi:hypothetical protein